jgi:hypothetical protein
MRVERVPRLLSESSQGMKRLSPRQADATLEVLKARVGTQAVEPGINGEHNHAVRSFFHGLVEPAESLILLAQQGLERQDRQAGGRPELTAVEYRMCPVCDRMLLGLEAQERRKLDESGILGRTLPCSSTCVGPSAAGQTPAVTSSAGA